MNTVDIIIKKRDGRELSEDEIRYIVDGYTSGAIPDYQMSAFLMAVYFRGMNDEETICLTKTMRDSGEVMDLSGIAGIKVDKHSTGGVGDKTTLIVGPAAAACGVPVAKMSGRGLGFTGGTIDKLESIPGFHVAMSYEEFVKQVNSTGIAVTGQTGHIAPADKKIYALRDVTGTVDNLSLITSSIMSKKLAAGSDAILLDVKCGSGAFMKTEQDARTLTAGPLRLNRDSREVSFDGREITLTKKEFDLLEYLMSHVNVAISRDQLLNEVWGYSYAGDTNVVDVYVRYIRQKTADNVITTIRGVGYMIKTE